MTLHQYQVSGSTRRLSAFFGCVVIALFLGLGLWAPTAVMAGDAPSKKSPLLVKAVSSESPRSVLFETYFSKHWGSLKKQLTELAASDDPSRLYLLKFHTNLLLDWAIDRGRKDVLDELLELYALPLKRMEIQSEYAFYGGVDGNRGNYAVVRTSRPFAAWLPPASKGFRVEPVLVISEFLYVVTRGLNALDGPNQTLAAFGPVLRDHYTRWILGVEDDPSKGAFSRRGWGCGNGRFNQLTFVPMINARKFNATPSYCNVVTDFELLIIAGAVELLTLDSRFHALVGLTPAERQALERYASLGGTLIRSRMTRTTVNVDGSSESGLLFDAGAWVGHPDMKHAGVTEIAFPNPLAPAAKPVPADIALDVSHARRLVQVFETLYRNRNVTRMDFPSESEMRQLANQLSFAVFDGDYRMPRFKNFINGSNGWYRVEYSGRRGFGHHPYSNSIEWIGSGYCRLERYQPRMRKLCDAVVAVTRSSESDVVNYRENELRKCFYRDFVKQQCGDLDFSKPSFYVLNLLSSLRD